MRPRLGSNAGKFVGVGEKECSPLIVAQACVTGLGKNDLDKLCWFSGASTLKREMKC